MVRATAIVGTNKGVIVVKDAFDQRKRFALPGGNIERGEKPLAAAAREVWEELHLRTLDSVLVGKAVSASGTNHDVCLLKVKGHLELGDYNTFVTNHYEIIYGGFFNLNHLNQVSPNYQSNVYACLNVYVDWCKNHDWRKYFSDGVLKGNTFILK